MLIACLQVTVTILSVFHPKVPKIIAYFVWGPKGPQLVNNVWQICW